MTKLGRKFIHSFSSLKAQNCISQPSFSLGYSMNGNERNRGEINESHFSIWPLKSSWDSWLTLFLTLAWLEMLESRTAEPHHRRSSSSRITTWKSAVQDRGLSSEDCGVNKKHTADYFTVSYRLTTIPLSLQMNCPISPPLLGQPQHINMLWYLPSLTMTNQCFYLGDDTFKKFLLLHSCPELFKWIHFTRNTLHLLGWPLSK